MDWKWCLKLFHVLFVLEMGENSLNKKERKKKELSGNKLNDYEEMSNIPSIYFLISTILKIGKQPKHSSFYGINVNVEFICILRKEK